MTGFVRTRTASLLAGSVGVLTLAATLSACGSASTTTGSGVGTVALGGSMSAGAAPSAAPGSPAGPSPTAAASSAAPSPQPSGSASQSGVVTRPSGVVGAVQTPKAQVGSAPVGIKLTAFDTAVAGQDGRTLFVGLESMGGACGQYSVVLRQSSSDVQVGLVHLPSTGRMCPQFVGPLNIEVQLSAPLAGRTVVDLANGQRLNVG